jgi:hypothetical protein
MANYSLSELTQKMLGKSITLGWDAVVFMNRAKVNSLLEQQYITRFKSDSFMKRIFGAPEMTPDGEELLDLSGLILSHPRISFEQASLRNSQVTATMDIVSGTVAYRTKGSNRVPGQLVYAYSVSANQGYTVTMKVDLALSKGTVDEQGRVLIDIGEGYECSCNLVGEEKSGEILGNFFRDLFLKQKPEDRIYELGKLDLADAGLLAPKSFIIRTMATDEGKNILSDDYGEGAVVLLVSTKGNPVEGDDPADGALDYLIPNDRDPVTGKAIYSGSLVLASRVMFDWYIQYPIQEMIGNGITFRRNSNSNEVSRTLEAISGDLKLPGISYVWVDTPITEERVDSVGEHKLKMYSIDAGKPLSISADSLGLGLKITWSGTQKQPFRVHIWHPPYVEDFDSNGEATVNLNVTFEPVVDASDNSLTFRSKDVSVGFFANYQPVLESYHGDFDFSVGFNKYLNEELNPALGEHVAYFKNAARFRNFGIPEIKTLAISNLLFPERNALILTEARLPGDLLMVGHIDPKETTFTLDPLLPLIKAGDQQTFTVRQLSLKAENITWTLRGVDNDEAIGSITAAGEYTAPSADILLGAAVRNVVTATYVDQVSGKEVTASALVTVVQDSVVVTPSIAQINMSDRKSVTFKATSLKGGTLRWTSRGGAGTLVPNGAEAIYTPPSTDLPDGSLQAVLFDVEDSGSGERAVASTLLSQGNFVLDITPAFHPGVRAAGSALLSVPTPHKPELFKWEVVAGEGTIDSQTGIFTAPATISTPYSVVKVTHEDDNFDTLGYSIIHLSEYARQSNWYNLDVFEFEVTAVPPTVYANGLQQAKVVVRVKPTDVDGEPVQLSESEMESLILVSADQRLPLEQVGAGGVPEGGRWHYSEAENDFEKYPHQRLASNSPSPERKAIQVKEFFVQCHKVESLRIAARLHNDNLRAFYSNPSPDDGEENRKVLNLVAVEPPLGGTAGGVAFTLSEEPTRVEGGEDDADLSTLDYYHVKLMIKSEQVPIRSVKFVGNRSMVKWESDTSLEDIHSITGYALRDDKNEQGDTILHIDEMILRKLGGQPQFPAQTVSSGHTVPVGEVLLSLQRREYWRYDQYVKAEFDSALEMLVYDKYGNQHSVNIGFDGTNRNKLKIIGQ